LILVLLAAGAGNAKAQTHELRLELDACIAHTTDQPQEAEARMREAAALESSTPKAPVTPGPTLPADELFGDLLMERKQPAQALEAYQRALQRYPRRFNGLLGAARAASASGDASLAKGFYQQLIEVAQGGTRSSALKEAEQFIARTR
jgi:tetratricopeptide (TPR) repeat protein